MKIIKPELLKNGDRAIEDYENFIEMEGINDSYEEDISKQKDSHEMWLSSFVLTFNLIIFVFVDEGKS